MILSVETSWYGRITDKTTRCVIRSLRGRGLWLGGKRNYSINQFANNLLSSSVEISFWDHLLRSTVKRRSSVEINCWDYLLRSAVKMWFVAIISWDLLLRSFVDINCWDYLLSSSVEISCWDHLLRSAVKIWFVAILCWDLLLRSSVKINCWD